MGKFQKVITEIKNIKKGVFVIDLWNSNKYVNKGIKNKEHFLDLQFLSDVLVKISEDSKNEDKKLKAAKKKEATKG